MIIDFAREHGLAILADEVYQENVYLRGDQFISFAQVMSEKQERDVSLFSFHSCSKGFLGECGQRGGYMELRNIPEDVVAQVTKLQSVASARTSRGRWRPTAWSARRDRASRATPLYAAGARRRSWASSGARAATARRGPQRDSRASSATWWRARCTPSRRSRCLRGRPTTSTAWPCWSRPASAWCPGSGFGQLPGTAHFRTTILPPTEKLRVVVERLAEFQAAYGV